MIVGSLLGTVAGLLGTGITAWKGLKEKKLDIEDKKADREHEIAMVKANTEAMIKEVEANIRVTEAEIAGEIAKQELQVFETSQKVGNLAAFNESYMERLYGSKFGTVIATILSFLLGMVDVIRGLMRPAITVILIYMLGTYLKVEAVDSTIIEYLTGLTTTAVVWWFGHRSLKQTDKTKL